MTSPVDPADLHHEVRSQLTRQGHRYTEARRRLIEALSSAGRPITLPEILDEAAGMAQSSAYRNLDMLERCSVIRRVSAGGDHTYFELSEPLLEHHHHLICVTCGRIEDVELTADVERAVDRGLAAAATELGFAPLHHSLDLYGHCAACGEPNGGGPDGPAGGHG